MCTIWNWVPQRLTVYTPQLLFTTQENGTSLHTLFNAIDHLEYSLIVIKTFQNEVIIINLYFKFKEKSNMYVNIIKKNIDFRSILRGLLER